MYINSEIPVVLTPYYFVIAVDADQTMHSEPAGIFYPRSSTGNGHEHSKRTFLHVKMHFVGNVMHTSWTYLCPPLIVFHVFFC